MTHISVYMTPKKMLQSHITSHLIFSSSTIVKDSYSMCTMSRHYSLLGWPEMAIRHLWENCLFG